MVRESKKTTIIAEAGVNHNGSLRMALEMVDAAADAGADVIKFQTFRAEHFISSFAEKAEYQKSSTGPGESQLDMVRKYELSEEDHGIIFDRSNKRGIEFLSTPFDPCSVDLLVSLGLRRLKIPSGEITNWPLVRKIGGTRKPVIISTGMSTIREIKSALGVYLLGALKHETIPTEEEADKVLSSREGEAYLRDNVVLLHCTTQYPAPYSDVNLLAMDTLADEFHVPVGYSDHTEGIVVSIAAAAMGAAVIEKHFTLNKQLSGPDHAASITPEELADLVSNIRVVDAALGSKIKKVAESEIKNMDVARKSLTALIDISRGELFTNLNLGVKRPGTGVSPTEFWDYIGRRANRHYLRDEQIDRQFYP
jgi:N-acetylneuraminate synthase